jgi:hypothetical protein
VNTDELQKGQGQVEFQNYTGPNTRIDTRAQIRAIGTQLGAAVRGGAARSGADARYFVIHSVTPPEGSSLDADIFGLGPGAGVDHIRNLRLIIQGYLESAYAYSAADATLLAEYITIYNAVFRGNAGYFNGAYKRAVTRSLAPERAGLSTRFSEWPGRTLMVIPLRNAAAGSASALDTSSLTDPRVIDEMRKDGGAGADQRNAMAGLKDREAAEAEEAARRRREAIAAEEARLAAEQAALAAERERLERERDALSARDAAARDAEAARRAKELADRAAALAAEREAAQKAEDFAEQKRAEAAQDRQTLLEESGGGGLAGGDGGDGDTGSAGALAGAGDGDGGADGDGGGDGDGGRAGALAGAGDGGGSGDDGDDGDTGSADALAGAGDGDGGAGGDDGGADGDGGGDGDTGRAGALAGGGDGGGADGGDGGDGDTGRAGALAGAGDGGGSGDDGDDGDTGSADALAGGGDGDGDGAGGGDDSGSGGFVVREDGGGLGIIGMIITGQTSMGSVVKVHPSSAAELRRSRANNVNIRTVTFIDNKIIALASQGSTMRLIEIDADTLEIKKEGADEIAPESLLWAKGAWLYAIIASGGNRFLGRFDTNLARQSRSEVPVHPYAAVNFQGDMLIITQRGSGQVLLLDPSDLTEGR